jgi:hypothetical protein
MNKTYTAILIDAVNRVIDEVEITDYKDIQKQIGCDTFESAHRFHDNGDTLYVDGEGLLNGTKHGFYFRGKLLAGNGLVVGSNAEGDTTDAANRMGLIQSMVTFMEFGDELNPEEMRKQAVYNVNILM